MKVTSTLKAQLLQAAQTEVKEKAEAHRKAQQELAEAQDILFWADKLVVGNEFTTPTTTRQDKQVYQRFYIPSKSGSTKGHYVYRYADGTVDCNCPGFVNNKKCWASTQVKGSRYGLSAWIGSVHDFDTLRNSTFNYSYR